jgi:hypothetical protein
MLSKKFPPGLIQKSLLSIDEWHPYPKFDERESWDRLPQDIRKELVTLGEERLDFAWPSLPATSFLEFVRTGNRNNYQLLYFARRFVLKDLVLAECSEGQGRFIDQIINGIWIICEETYWGLPAHLELQSIGPGLPDTEEPTMDIFAGETASLLAWTHYLLKPQLDEVSPLLSMRIVSEIKRRILSPCIKRDDFWWMAFTGKGDINNWNPWCNSSWLTTVLLVEDDLTQKIAAIKKIFRSLDKYIAVQPRDGGCDEGPGYWGKAGACLFECLDLLSSATNGRLNAFDEPLVQEIGRFIYRAQISKHYFINFADTLPVLTPPDTLIYRYGQSIDDSSMLKLGKWAAVNQPSQKPSLNKNLARDLAGLFCLDQFDETEAAQPLPRDVWLDQTEVMVARDKEGSPQGFCLAAKGGHNAENHNHNDVGNFLVYRDGKPMIIDAGSETNTAKTFSDERYDIWTMQSDYHNLPTLNGEMQRAGKAFAAADPLYQSGNDFSQLELDISQAYPPTSRSSHWKRTFRLNRGKSVEIRDEAQFLQPTEVILNFMTVCKVSSAQLGKLLFEEASLPEKRSSAMGTFAYNSDIFSLFEIERITLSDEKLERIWGTSLTRIRLKTQDPLSKLSHKVLIKTNRR